MMEHNAATAEVTWPEYVYKVDLIVPVTIERVRYIGYDGVTWEIESVEDGQREYHNNSDLTVQIVQQWHVAKEIAERCCREEVARVERYFEKAKADLQDIQNLTRPDDDQ